MYKQYITHLVAELDETWARQMYDILMNINGTTFQDLRDNPYHMDEQYTGILSMLFHMYNMINKEYPIFTICTSTSPINGNKYKIIHDVFNGFSTEMKLDTREDPMPMFQEYMIGSIISKVANFRNLSVQRTLGYSLGTPPVSRDHLCTINLYRSGRSGRSGNSGQLHLQYIPDSISLQEYIKLKGTIRINGIDLSHDKSLIYIIFRTLATLYSIQLDIPGFKHDNLFDGIRIVVLDQLVPDPIYFSNIGSMGTNIDLHFYTDTLIFLTDFSKSEIYTGPVKGELISYVSPVMTEGNDKQDISDLILNILTFAYPTEIDVRYNWKNKRWITKGDRDIDIELLYILYNILYLITKDSTIKSISRKFKSIFRLDPEKCNNCLESVEWLNSLLPINISLTDCSLDDALIYMLHVFTKISNRGYTYKDYTRLLYTERYLSLDIKVNDNILKRCILMTLTDKMDYSTRLIRQKDMERIDREWNSIAFIHMEKGYVSIHEVMNNSCRQAIYLSKASPVNIYILQYSLRLLNILHITPSSREVYLILKHRVEEIAEELRLTITKEESVALCLDIL